MTNPGDCPKCGSQFSEGHIADHLMIGSVVSTWVEGAPVGLLADITRGGTERHKIRAWRCTGCGYLESYAPNARA
ncbi:MULTISPECIES: hypothetical protein [unclassified Sphingomonas]|uniref:hypothetical protein n=1 Tax=Sphingomonas TaxID=13687 RepID=UPI00095C820F|nr:MULTISPECIES: hypothetical protein [unclassified Sphingomonas]MBN8813100.1 hypothetical protein [Sphingomonas sp.]OJY54177.1 MAG: hypothetical protein BGP17_03465 [Sphingomonas sp. 67-41]